MLKLTIENAMAIVDSEYDARLHTLTLHGQGVATLGCEIEKSRIMDLLAGSDVEAVLLDEDEAPDDHRLMLTLAGPDAEEAILLDENETPGHRLMLADDFGCGKAAAPYRMYVHVESVDDVDWAA